MSLDFVKANNSKDIKMIYDYNLDAFSDSPGFNWNYDEIKKEVKDGWNLYGVEYNGEVIAALFYKLEDRCLFSKNTSIKLSHQGSGFSHKIKDFFEKQAKELKVKQIIHYCSIDNFRMYSLNESHGYVKTSKRLGENGQVVEWIKDIK
ncbi:hypothetical protein [Halobacteriovorax sp. JY17]|uniref:hypothetical protein n=1 Tax=Halobacteriovorax sp. JY17 TaxID=2014617 RepID=UPI000C39734D|nr:hypothetical protein [Halobacteriovorax sp. JY17]PIK16004.1 MAG: hypothetical protein CES88_04555 [Halobacteriovorax sp. JY17]